MNLLIFWVRLHTVFVLNFWNFTFSFQFQQKKRTKIIYTKIYAVSSLKENSCNLCVPSAQIFWHKKPVMLIFWQISCVAEHSWFWNLETSTSTNCLYMLCTKNNVYWRGISLFIHSHWVWNVLTLTADVLWEENSHRSPSFCAQDWFQEISRLSMISFLSLEYTKLSII